MSVGYAEHLRRLREQYSLQPPSPPQPTKQHAPYTAAASALETANQGGRVLTYSPTRTFHDERAELFRMVQPPYPEGPQPVQNSRTSSAAPQGYTQPQQRSWEPAAAGTAVSQQRATEILQEVETLSYTITQLHKERAASDAEWGARLRSHREHMEAKDAAMLSLEEQYAKSELTIHDLKEQLHTSRREAASSKREMESGRQALEQSQLDAQERERLIEAQEHCMKDLEQRLDNATHQSTEWERRIVALQRQREQDTEVHRKQRQSQGDLVRSMVGIVLTLARGAEEGCLQLRGNGPHPWDSRSESPGSSASSLATDVDRLQHILHSIADKSDASFIRENDTTRDELQSAHTQVQSLVRSWATHVRQSLAAVESQRSQSARAATDAGRLTEQLRLLEDAKQRSDDESAAMREENRLLVAEIERLRAESKEIKSTLGTVVREAESREQGRGTMEVDLHRVRLRVNELEAMVTRVQSQKALIEEEAKTNAAQYKQTIAQKEAALRRLKQQSGLASSASTAELSDASGEEGPTVPARGSRRSSSAVGNTTTSAVTNSYLKEQNQQLAAHISFLQKRLERIGPSQDSQNLSAVQ